jgi:hypothetical protein
VSPATHPNVYEQARAGKVKQSLTASARQEETRWRGDLEHALQGLGTGRIRAPQRLERRSAREGGGYRSTRAEQADYDWFYGLGSKEQARIRANWMTDDRHAPTPDEIAEKMPVRDWLNHTRAIDMARALQTGRHIQADRYGGIRPSQLIAGEPYDPAKIHHREPIVSAVHVKDARRARRTGAEHAPKNPRNLRRGIAYKPDGSLDVQFFTDEQGIVHPIRASYTEHPDERHERERYEAYKQRLDAPKREYEEPF